MSVLQVDKHLEFLPSDNYTTSIEPPKIHEPEIVIGNSDSEDSSEDSPSSCNNSEHSKDKDSTNATEMEGRIDDLVDTEDDDRSTHNNIPFAPYPPITKTTHLDGKGNRFDQAIDQITENCDSSTEGQDNHKSSKVTFQEERASNETNESESFSSSKDSLVSPTLSSRDSTVVDLDTGTATVYQKRATAMSMDTPGEQWIEQSTTYHTGMIKYVDKDDRDEDLEHALDMDQDDINTISSDATGHYKNHEEANKEEAPSSTRYQLGFQIDDEDLETLLKECSKTNDYDDSFPDTLSKTKALISSFFRQAKTLLDHDFAIISWAEASTFEMIRTINEIPSNTVQFACILL